MGRSTSRIYKRGRRFWADFRDYVDVGGSREPLTPHGSRMATKDRDVAERLAADRLEELKELRKRLEHGDVQAGTPPPTVAEAARDHLVKKRQEGTSKRHVAMVQGQLEAAVAYFGAGRELASISTREVAEWVRVLQKRDDSRGGTLSNATVRKYLNALSDLFSRAVSDGHALHNPARALYKKPTPEKKRARYWHPWEVALLLESARTLPRDAAHGGRGGGGSVSAKTYPHIYPLLATAALTGARKSELFGLEVDDVSFKLRRIFIRPNQWRDLKTAGSERDVPLWPQLEEILRRYLLERERHGGLGSLLFPSHRSGEEKPLDNVDRVLDTIGQRVGIRKPRLHAFRHSYTAARIQTLDRGAPVHIWQVARELGHQSTGMIESRYGHLARVANRADEVAFRLEDAPAEEREKAQKALDRLAQF